MSQAENPVQRTDYRHWMTIQTRWIDNDIYAHVNNAVYYTYFDTVINHYLIVEGGLDPRTGDTIGFAVETSCKFFAPIAFPDVLEVGLRVGKLGNSSVQYELAIFKQSQEQPCATGYFVHVFVDRQTQRPTTIPGALRAALTKLMPD